MYRRIIVILMIIFPSVCFAADNDYEFNLTGVWTIPNRDIFTTYHNVDNDSLMIRWTLMSRAIVRGLTFNGEVHRMGRGDFSIMLDSANFVFQRGDVKCITNSITIIGNGYMTGELGQRQVHMRRCNINISFSCENGIARNSAISCAGIWD